MTGQLALSLPRPPISWGSENFFLSPSNREAYEWVDSWPAWSAYGLVLRGPAGAGKTHLARIWQHRTHATEVLPEALPGMDLDALAARSSCIVIENFERCDAEMLLRLLNCIRDHRGYALLTTQLPVQAWSFTLPDLTSRLGALPKAALTVPDDALLCAILTKQFTDRQLRAPKEVIEWLVARIERSFEALAAAVELIDKETLMQSRGITLPFVQRLFAP